MNTTEQLVSYTNINSARGLNLPSFNHIIHTNHESLRSSPITYQFDIHRF